MHLPGRSLLHKQNLLHHEPAFHPRDRIRPNPDFERTRLDSVMQRCTPKTKPLHWYGKLYGLGFTRLKRDPLETFEFFHWACNTPHQITHIELHHFCADALTGVLNL